MPELKPGTAAIDSLAKATSRRGFLAKVGAALLVLGARSAAGSAPRSAAQARYDFCGHTYTTGTCPHPTGLPRVDVRGLSLRAKDGKPIDDLGRPINGQGQPVDESGELLRDLEDQPLPPAPRTPVCQAAASRFGLHTQADGSWYRCCYGRVRKLMDCCSYSNTRINGDAALPGYCFGGRKVFCVMYRQTDVPC